MIYQLCKFICDDITNHEASLRQEPGWGGVEVCRPVPRVCARQHHRVRVRYRIRVQTLISKPAPLGRKYIFLVFNMSNGLLQGKCQLLIKKPELIVALK